MEFVFIHVQQARIFSLLTKHIALLNSLNEFYALKSHILQNIWSEWFPVLYDAIFFQKIKASFFA